MNQAKTIKVILGPYLYYDELLRQLPDPRTLDKGAQYILDIEYQQCMFINDHLCQILVAYYKGLKGSGIDVTAKFDTSINCDAVNYAGRIGFFDQLDIDYSYPFTKHDPAGRFIPIETIAHNGYTLDPRLSQKILDALGVSESITDAVLFSMGELVSNVGQHSRSNFGGVLFGQIYPNRKVAVFTIIDPGVGIHYAFQNGSNSDYNLVSEEEAIQICVGKGVTCGNGMGQGLFLIKEIISRNKGDLRIVSGNYCLSVVNGNVNVRRSNYWQGTMILMEFSLEEKVDMAEVFNSNSYDKVELW